MAEERLEKYMGGVGTGGLITYINTRSDGFFRYVLEQSAQALFGWVPGLIGIGLRYFLYRLLLPGKSGVIEKSVELFHMNNLHFGASVYIDSMCRLHASSAAIDIGDNCRVMRNAYLCTYVSNAREGEGIVIGANCWIGVGTTLSAGNGRLHLGNNVLIGPEVVIVTGNHDFRSLETSTMKQQYIGSPITIGDNVWIGSKAVILGGVSVGDRAVIGAGAVVTRDVPAGGVVAGVPAKDIDHKYDKNQAN